MIELSSKISRNHFGHVRIQCRLVKYYTQIIIYFAKLVITY